MSTALEVVQTAYDRYLNGDLDGLLANIAEDVSWRSIGPLAAIPWAGDHRGHGEVRRFFECLGGLVAIESYEIKRFIAQDDSVVVHSDVVARMRNGGVSVRFDKCDIFRVRDGKIAEFIEFVDTAAVQKMLQPAIMATVAGPGPVASALV